MFGIVVPAAEKNNLLRWTVNREIVDAPDE